MTELGYTKQMHKAITALKDAQVEKVQAAKEAKGSSSGKGGKGTAPKDAQEKMLPAAKVAKRSSSGKGGKGAGGKGARSRSSASDPSSSSAGAWLLPAVATA